VDGITDGLSVLKSARARAVIPTVKFSIGSKSRLSCHLLLAATWPRQLPHQLPGVALLQQYKKRPGDAIIIAVPASTAFC
jgi:hypothetical protein